MQRDQINKEQKKDKFFTTKCLIGFFCEKCLEVGKNSNFSIVKSSQAYEETISCFRHYKNILKNLMIFQQTMDLCMNCMFFIYDINKFFLLPGLKKIEFAFRPVVPAAARNSVGYAFLMVEKNSVN